MGRDEEARKEARREKENLRISAGTPHHDPASARRLIPTYLVAKLAPLFGTIGVEAFRVGRLGFYAGVDLLPVGNRKTRVGRTQR